MIDVISEIAGRAGVPVHRCDGSECRRCARILEMLRRTGLLAGQMRVEDAAEKR